MTPFEDIYERAVTRHGEQDLVARFPALATDGELRALTDARYLALMTKRVFAAGFRWKVIQAKWDGFEEAFFGFDPGTVADLSENAIDALAADTRIVRNRPKILSTIDNARFVLDVAKEHGSFGNFIADWPSTDTVGLWAALKAGGNRLGGDTGAWFLRLVGKDTFRFSSDVVQGLIDNGVLVRPPGASKAARMAVQEAMNRWAAESGLSMGAISVTLACSTGEVYERR